ncbi:MULTISPECIES: hypothetical protein [unclassified Streptomyces]|uniref:hypothetical protein n=1 Tax=unclassified Streptomyces TaxID=2593676 RepID=UPI0032541DA0
MTATRTRRLAPLLIATLLAGGAASLSSTAFAAPTTTTTNLTTDSTAPGGAGGKEVATYLTDSPRTIKHITKKPRPVKKLIRTVERYGTGITTPFQGGGDGGTDGTRRVPKYPTTPCVNLDCL